MSRLTSSLDDGLVGHWTMDDTDTKSGIITDRSPYDNHGDLNNGVTTGNNGVVGEAFLLNGTDQNVTVDKYTRIDGSTEATISYWANIHNTDDDPALVNQYNSSPRKFHTDISTENIRFSFTDDSGTNLYPPDSSSINEHQWYHIVLLLDGEEARLYIDGELDSSGSEDGFGPIASGETPLRIGSWDGQDYMEGEIDDVRIYNRALSEDEIKRLYNMRSQNTWDV